MEINIETIPHSEQRYDTVGDWRYTGVGTSEMSITVSDLGNTDYELLVAVHELVEAYLCGKAGVSEQSVSDFDIDFEKNRSEGDMSEPGDSENAPYRTQHIQATQVEKLLANILGVDWNQYDSYVNNLVDNDKSHGGTRTGQTENDISGGSASTTESTPSQDSEGEGVQDTGN